MTRSDAQELALDGPLPEGTVVIEAGAGTGKTFTVAALAARYVAERDIPLERMLIVTFTRAATGELRARVRNRLVRSATDLDAVLGGLPPQDPLTPVLAQMDPLEARKRIGRALVDFDRATIATTHGFCLQMLKEIGAPGQDTGGDVVESAGGLVEEVLADLYLAAFVASQRQPLLLPDARAVAVLATSQPGARLLPPLDQVGDDDGVLRHRLAMAVRREAERRKRLSGLVTFDDLQGRLRAALEGDRGAADRLRQRFQVVLVDEFQDTDPEQWAILQAAFCGPGSTLVLVGDPKQAIYAFRGADVHSYLAAAASAAGSATLRINRRSDQPLLDAYDAVFGQCQMGAAGIEYRPCRAASRAEP